MLRAHSLSSSQALRLASRLIRSATAPRERRMLPLRLDFNSPNHGPHMRNLHAGNSHSPFPGLSREFSSRFGASFMRSSARVARFTAPGAYGWRQVKGIQRFPKIVLQARLRSVLCGTFGNPPSEPPLTGSPRALRRFVSIVF